MLGDVGDNGRIWYKLEVWEKWFEFWEKWFGLGEWKSIYHFIPVFPIFISFYTPLT